MFYSRQGYSGLHLSQLAWLSFVYTQFPFVYDIVLFVYIDPICLRPISIRSDIRLPHILCIQYLFICLHPLLTFLHILFTYSLLLFDNKHLTYSLAQFTLSFLAHRLLTLYSNLFTPSRLPSFCLNLHSICLHLPNPRA